MRSTLKPLAAFPASLSSTSPPPPRIRTSTMSDLPYDDLFGSFPDTFSSLPPTEERMPLEGVPPLDSFEHFLSDIDFNEVELNELNEMYSRLMQETPVIPHVDETAPQSVHSDATAFSESSTLSQGPTLYSLDSTVVMPKVFGPLDPMIEFGGVGGGENRGLEHERFHFTPPLIGAPAALPDPAPPIPPSEPPAIFCFETSNNKKTFFCPFCDHGTLYSLVIALLRSTESDFCPASARSFNLRTHVDAVHSRIKPFACPQDGCGSRFARKHDLQRHIETVHTPEHVNGTGQGECGRCTGSGMVGKRKRCSCSDGA